MNKEFKICPECGRLYRGYSAISRKDNETEICPSCGIIEALPGIDEDDLHTILNDGVEQMERLHLSTLENKIWRMLTEFTACEIDNGQILYYLHLTDEGDFKVNQSNTDKMIVCEMEKPEGWEQMESYEWEDDNCKEFLELIANFADEYRNQYGDKKPVLLRYKH